MDNLPEPLVPAGTDVSNLDGFMLNVERLLASELLAIGTPEQCWAAFMLWCRAWKQVPGGSLPNNDRILASFSGAGKRWKQVKEIALHGFVLCSDGRFYHRFLCREVLRAAKAKTAYETRRETDRKRLAEWRLKRGGTGEETPTETCFVAEETGTGTVRKKEGSVSSLRSETAASGTPDPQKGVFDLGKQVLGKSAGGQITKLLKHVSGNCDRAMELLHIAAGKSDAGEYIAGILRGNGEDVAIETDRLYRQWGVE